MAEGIVVLTFMTILGALVPPGIGSSIATVPADGALVQSPLHHLRGNRIPPEVRPRPARPGIETRTENAS